MKSDKNDDRVPTNIFEKLQFVEHIMATNTKKKTYGKSCCVVDCAARFGREDCGFFRVLRRSKEQTDNEQRQATTTTEAYA